MDPGELHPIQIVGGSDLNTTIGDAVSDSCIAEAWGSEIAAAIRDGLVEISRNAIAHGSAKSVSLDIRHSHVKLVDDGEAFDLIALRTHPKGRGGALAIDELFNTYAERLFIESNRVGETNELVIALLTSSEDILHLTPCARRIDVRTLRQDESIVVYPVSCRTIYMVLPGYFSVSDVFELHTATILHKVAPDRIVFVVEGVSRLVARHLTNLFPGSRILST